MVENEIDTICQKVMNSHVEKIEERGDNLKFVVCYGNKQAIFKLKEQKNTFKDIKKSVATYFGLPEEMIFLQNNRGEILLKNQLIIDELFPLKSCKIKGFMPQINVIF